MDAKIGGDDVSSVEETEVSQFIEIVNGSDDSVREFDACTSSGENVYDIFENEDEFITDN